MKTGIQIGTVEAKREQVDNVMFEGKEEKRW